MLEPRELHKRALRAVGRARSLVIPRDLDPHHEDRVRLHIKTVYEFTREMFPLHDPDSCVDDVFHRASTELRSAHHPDDAWHLLRYAIETTVTRYSDPAWWRQNADLTVEIWRAALPMPTDGALALELERLLSAFGQMTLREQSIVRLLTLSQAISAHAYPIVLGLDAAATDELMRRARRSFDELFAQANSRSN